MFCSSPSGEKNGNWERRSKLSNRLYSLNLPVRKDLSVGPQGTKPTPNSSHVSSIWFSANRSPKEYWVCKADTGNSAWAFRKVSGATSESPNALPFLQRSNLSWLRLLLQSALADPIGVGRVDRLSLFEVVLKNPQPLF